MNINLWNADLFEEEDIYEFMLITADVIVAGDDCIVGLRYAQNVFSAPYICVKAEKSVAAKMLKRIKDDESFFIEYNPPLARGLYSEIELGEPIPGNYYPVVAEILARVYKESVNRQGGNI